MSSSFLRSFVSTTTVNVGTTQLADGGTLPSEGGVGEYQGETDGTVYLPPSRPVGFVVAASKPSNKGVLTVEPPVGETINGNGKVVIPGKGARTFRKASSVLWEDITGGWRPLPALADGTLVDAAGILAGGAADLVQQADGYSWEATVTAGPIAVYPTAAPLVMAYWDLDYFLQDFYSSSYGNSMEGPDGLEVAFAIDYDTGWPDWLAAMLQVSVNTTSLFPGGCGLWSYPITNQSFASKIRTGVGDIQFQTGQPMNRSGINRVTWGVRFQWFNATTIQQHNSWEWTDGTNVYAAEEQGITTSQSLSAAKIILRMSHTKDTYGGAATAGTGTAAFKAAWRPVPRPGAPF